MTAGTPAVRAGTENLMNQVHGPIIAIGPRTFVPLDHFLRTSEPSGMIRRRSAATADSDPSAAMADPSSGAEVGSYLSGGNFSPVFVM